MVNLALTLATNWQEMAATHVQVVFVFLHKLLILAQTEQDLDELAETALFVCE